MREVKTQPEPVWMKLSRRMDGLVGVFSPGAAARRAQYRMAYDVIDRSRKYTSRTKHRGTGDTVLTAARQDDLRELLRDLCRRNSTIGGMLTTETNDVVGAKGPGIESRATGGWAKKAQDHWRRTMVESACEIGGRFNWPMFIKKAYRTYRRDGDFLMLETADGLQWIEGEQCGTPTDKSAAEYIKNGVAYNASGKLLGYYIGRPNKWGWIDSGSWKAYPAASVHMLFNPERFSQSRGEPALTSALRWIDMLDGYLEAELVAARVNACFSMFISRKNEYGDQLPEAYTQTGSGTGYDVATGYRQEKVEPGVIMYGEDGETATGIGQSRPGEMFEPFVKMMMALTGRGLNMPLMYITLDFSGATFMNARIALQSVQKLWMAEQEDVVKPATHWVWNKWVDREITAGRLPDHEEKYEIEIFANRWPYVDPVKELQALKIEQEIRLNSRKRQTAARGEDWEDIESELQDEEERILKSPAKKQETSDAA